MARSVVSDFRIRGFKRNRASKQEVYATRLSQEDDPTAKRSFREFAGKPVCETIVKWGADSQPMCNLKSRRG